MIEAVAVLIKVNYTGPMASKKLERPLRIAEAAKLLGVSQPTLRRWEAIGKFVPRRHPMNGYRLYDRDRVIKLRDEIMTGAG